MIAGIEGKMRDLTQRTKEQAAATKSLQNACISANSAGAALAKTAAGLFSVKMAADFVKQVANVRGEFQKLEVAFNTMLGSGVKADKLMSEVVDLAAKTPFFVSDVAQGAKQLLAYGESADTAVDTLRRLGDIAAGVSIQLNRMVGIYGRVMAFGKLNARTLIQFRSAGIPIIQQLATTLGKSEKEIQEMVTAGTIGFEQVKKAIIAMTNEGGKFANLTEKQSKTITGQISVIQGLIQNMFNDIGKQTEGPINAALSAVRALIENYEKVGMVLAGLVVTYGAYRVAIMALNASLKAAMVESHAYNASVISQIAAEKGAIAAELTRTAVLKGLTEAQIDSALASDNVTRALLTQIGASKGATTAIGAEIGATSKLIASKVAAAGPYLALAALVVGLTAAIYKGTKQVDEYAEAQKRLSKQTNSLNTDIAKEQATIDQLFGELKGAKKGTKEWDEARKKIYDKYGDYLRALGDEKTALNDIETAYKLVGIAAKNSAMERARASSLDDSAKTYGEKVGKVGSDIRAMLIKAYGDKKGAELFSGTISKYIGTQLSALPAEVWKIMDDALAAVDGAWGSRTLNKDGTRDRSRGERSRYDWTDKWAKAAKAKAEYDAEVQVAQDIFTTEAPDAAIKRLNAEKAALEDTTKATKAFNAEQEKLNNQSRAIHNEITKLFSPDEGDKVLNKYLAAAKKWEKTQSDAFADDKALVSGYLAQQANAVEAQMAANKKAHEQEEKNRKEKIAGINSEIKAQQAYKKLQKAAGAGGGGGGGSFDEDDGGYTLQKLKDRKKLQEQRAAEDKAFVQRQEEINKLADGYRKQELQAQLDYDKAIIENRRAYEDELASLIDTDKQIWLKAKKGRKEKDYTIGAGGTNITVDKEYYQQQEDFITAAFNKGVAERFTDYLAELGDVEAQAQQMERQLNEQIAAETMAAQDETLTAEARALHQFLADRLQLVKEARLAEQAYETQQEFMSNQERLTAYKDYLEKRAKMEKEQTKKAGETEQQKKAREERIDAKVKYDIAEMDFSQVVDFGKADEVLDKFFAKWKAKMALFPADMQPALQASMQDELAALYQSLAQRGDNKDMKEWFDSLGKMAIYELKSALEQLKTALAGVNKEADPDTWNALSAQIAVVEEKVEEAADGVKKGTLNWKEIGDVLNDVASSFEEVGDAVGGTIGALLKGFGQLASGAVSMANAIHAISEATSAAEKASAILAVISAAVKIVSYFATNIKNAAEETISAAAANEAYADSLRSIANEIRQLKEENIFGSNNYQKYLNSVEDATTAFAELEKNFGQGVTTDTRNWTKKWQDSVSPNSTFDPIGAISQLIAPASGSQGGRTLRSFLKDGKFTKESLEELKAYYEEYGQYMDSQSKAIIENWIRDGEKYVEYVEEQTKYLQNLVGDLAGNVADSLVDSFVDAGDAFANLDDIAKDFAKNLVKSRVEALLMSRIFTASAQQEFQDLITAGNTQGAIDYINSLLEKAKTDPEIINTIKALEGLNDIAVDEQATKKGIANASQESVDENNGRLTAIQGHTFEINDSVKVIRNVSSILASQCGAILGQVIGIHRDTTEIKQGLVAVASDVRTTKNNVDTIVTKGVLAR